MNVADVLKNKPADIISTGADASIADAAKLLADKKVGAALVTGPDGGLAGIISERDIVRGLAQQGAGLLDAPVSTLMTKEVETCGPDDSVEELMQRMTAGRFRHFPVLEDGQLKAVVSIGDLVKSRLGELEYEASTLKQYISGS